MKPSKDMRVWFADKWQAPIPKEFSELKFTKSGGFDRRRGKGYYTVFKLWLAVMDEQADGFIFKMTRELKSDTGFGSAYEGKRD